MGSLVNISPEVLLLSAGHDVHAPDFEGRPARTMIADRAWIASRAIVRPGAEIGEERPWQRGPSCAARSCPGLSLLAIRRSRLHSESPRHSSTFRHIGDGSANRVEHAIRSRQRRASARQGDRRVPHRLGRRDPITRTHARRVAQRHPQLPCAARQDGPTGEVEPAGEEVTPATSSGTSPTTSYGSSCTPAASTCPSTLPSAPRIRTRDPCSDT